MKNFERSNFFLGSRRRERGAISIQFFYFLFFIRSNSPENV